MSNAVHLDGLTSIVAIDLKGAIGCRNALPWTLKTDMSFFRQQTLGNSVIMGRKTYESIGGCLRGRRNVILSHNDALFATTDNCRLALSVGEALYRIALDKSKRAFVIGGAQTYEQLSPFVDQYIVTVVDHQVVDADAFLSAGILQALEDWKRELIASHPAAVSRDDYSFKIYRLEAPDADLRRQKLQHELACFASLLPRRAIRKRSPNGRVSFPGQERLAL